MSHSITIPAPDNLERSDLYAVNLRAVGDDLQTKNVEDFELETDGTNYYVKAAVASEGSKSTNSKPFLSSLRNFFKNQSTENHESSNIIELCYTAEDIERLEHLGRGKRKESNKMPDTYSLSQTLRSVGAYLDLKEATLVHISKKDTWVTLQYNVAYSGLKEEKFMLSTLYDFCVHMYIQRNDR